MWTVVFHDGREPIWFDIFMSWREAEGIAEMLNDLCRTDVYRAAPIPFAGQTS